MDVPCIAEAEFAGVGGGGGGGGGTSSIWYDPTSTCDAEDLISFTKLPSCPSSSSS
jgi:hypothetical protein